MEDLRAKRVKGNLERKSPKAAFAMTVISVILLCNANIGLIDLLPDAIAYFMLARVFALAADCAPFFEEARAAFIKLFWINIAKLPALMIVALSRTENTFGNDTSVLVTFVIEILEIIVIIPAIKNIFAALFRLGQRTDAVSLISPFGKKKKLLPDHALLLTYAFMMVKIIFSVLPEIFLLTRTADEFGTLVTVSKGYPITLLIGQSLGLVLGITWAVIIIKYIKAVHNEGQFSFSLEALSENDPENRFALKREMREIGKAMLLFTIGTFFSFEIRFDNTASINILPHVFYIIMMFLAVAGLKSTVSKKRKNAIYLSGAIHALTSILQYSLEVYFLYTYGYDDLITEGVASKVYTALEVMTAVDFAMLVIFTVMIAAALCDFVYEQTGIPPQHERYSRTDRDYHKGLITRVRWFAALAITTGVAKLINTVSRGTVRMLFTGAPQISYYPALEWMGLVLTICSTALAGYSMYFFSLLKEEYELKYTT